MNKVLVTILLMILSTQKLHADWTDWIAPAAYVGTGIYAINKISGSVDKNTDSNNGVSEDERECRKLVKQLTYRDKTMKRYAYCCKQIENPSEICNTFLDKIYE